MTDSHGRALARPGSSFTSGRLLLLSVVCLIGAFVLAMILLPRQHGVVRADDFQSSVLSVEAKRSDIQVTKASTSDASSVIIEWQPAAP